MDKSRFWRIVGMLPIYILIGIYVVYLIIYGEWEALVFLGLIFFVIYFELQWVKYCMKKQFEAEKEGESESY